MRGWGGGMGCVCAWPGGGGMRGMHAPQPDTTRYGRSMSGRYASYWNAFLFSIDSTRMFNFKRFCEIFRDLLGTTKNILQLK